MILKLGAAVCGLVLLGLTVGTIVKRPQRNWADEPPQGNWADRNSIQALARRAKDGGQTKATVPGPIIDYPGMEMRLDEALRNYSAVVAEPIERKSYLLDADNIMTAYKFRIVETLSQRNAAFCNTCPPVRDVTNRLQPTLPNEFVLEVSGGTMVVDGVEVTMVNTGKLHFENGKKYLLFISFTPGGMAELGAGPSGVFKLSDTDSLESIANSKRELPAEIATRFSGKLSRFKQATKR